MKNKLLKVKCKVSCILKENKGFEIVNIVVSLIVCLILAIGVYYVVGTMVDSMDIRLKNGIETTDTIKY